MVKKMENLTDSQLAMRLLGIIATNSFKSMQDRVQFLNKHGLNANECSRVLGISSRDASSYILRKKKKSEVRSSG